MVTRYSIIYLPFGYLCATSCSISNLVLHSALTNFSSAYGTAIFFHWWAATSLLMSKHWLLAKMGHLKVNFKSLGILITAPNTVGLWPSGIFRVMYLTLTSLIWPSFLVWSPPWYCNRYLLCYKQTSLIVTSNGVCSTRGFLALVVSIRVVWNTRK